MRILICGIDGYIGWPLAIHLLNENHEVCGLDNFVRRKRVRMAGSNSLIPIPEPVRRATILKQWKNFIDYPAEVDMTNYFMLDRVLEEFLPDAIVHLAEQPSAPWSMESPSQAGKTQYDNVLGTLNLLWTMKKHCPMSHLIKLGTMGEYGTPDCEIPEGEIPRPCLVHPRELLCPMHGLPFPKSPNSFYHLSKVHDTNNIIFACKTWGLRSTDIMQGIVFGLNETDNPNLLTRFDHDEHFGTVINRFCVQAIIGHTLTVYGRGGQTRGFLTLGDSIQCLSIALENPPKAGEYRTFNQFENIYKVVELANMVAKVSSVPVAVGCISNPRKEAEQHYYNPTHQKLFDLGYVPTTNVQGEIAKLIETILPYKDRVIEKVIMPKVKWND